MEALNPEMNQGGLVTLFLVEGDAVELRPDQGRKRLLVIISNLPFKGVEKSLLPRGVVQLVMLGPKRSLLLLSLIGENPKKEDVAEVVEPVEQVSDVGGKKIMAGVVKDESLSGKISGNVRASGIIVTTCVTWLEDRIKNVVASDGG